eukprot:TRINITY_DN19937_c0_g1_i1.p1 TRINITY_DN19937_c0_g1~~TRINITY_DN19937_c0_g1_i1.p1  ORF type:complete len:159 (+),score=2.63 TRINITY_DN19937_c0_g1_i1:87-563(+)
MEIIGERNPKQQEEGTKSWVWDCDSRLYDSFELKSFKRQLDSAIASRTLSMPRLSETVPPPPPPPVTHKSSKISRSLHRLLRSFFRPKPAPNKNFHIEERPCDGFYVVYHQSGALGAIPEVSEKGVDFVGVSPESDTSSVTRSVSERFTRRGLGISCV